MGGTLVGGFTLHVAICTNRFGIIRFLLDQRSKRFVFPNIRPNQGGSLMIRLTMQSGSLTVLNCLLRGSRGKRCLLPNVSLSSQGRSVLRVTTRVESTQILRLLLRHSSRKSFVRTTLSPLNDDVGLLCGTVRTRGYRTMLILVRHSDENRFLCPRLLLRRGFCRVVRYIKQTCYNQVEGVVLGTFRSRPVR